MPGPYWTASMKILVNNKEYSSVLAQRVMLAKLRPTEVNPPVWKKTEKFVKEVSQMLYPSLVPDLRLVPGSCKDQQRLQEAIKSVVTQDLKKWLDNLTSHTPGISHTVLMKYINSQYHRFQPNDRMMIQNLFQRSSISTISKQIMQAYPDNSSYVPRDDIDEHDPDRLFIRNTVNNESLLRTRIKQNLPFMFMDNGYTNFLETGKKWFRLSNNHIHHQSCKRGLDPKRRRLFPRLPESWRSTGHDVIVVEPSSIQCKLFDIDPAQWRRQVEAGIKNNLTGYKRIVFREKVDKKIRQNFFHYLLGEDVYCVINYNSNAAIEAVWAGVPVITLGDHITNTISVREIDQINNLRRPDLERWLRYLSYRQYTLEEIANGTARRIMEEVLRDV
jgi:hypothetical protein